MATKSFTGDALLRFAMILEEPRSDLPLDTEWRREILVLRDALLSVFRGTPVTIARDYDERTPTTPPANRG